MKDFLSYVGVAICAVFFYMFLQSKDTIDFDNKMVTIDNEGVKVQDKTEHENEVVGNKIVKGINKIFGKRGVTQEQAQSQSTTRPMASEVPFVSTPRNYNANKSECVNILNNLKVSEAYNGENYITILIENNNPVTIDYAKLKYEDKNAFGDAIKTEYFEVNMISPFSSQIIRKGLSMDIGSLGSKITYTNVVCSDYNFEFRLGKGIIRK